MRPNQTYDPSFELHVPKLPRGWAERDRWTAESWRDVASVELVLSDGSGAPDQGTRVQVGYDDRALYVRFECADHDAWSRFTRRDEPLYEDEAVEVFLAAGHETPTEYYEVEVSPRGVLFDARIANPHGDRREMVTDITWDWPGVRWAAGPLGHAQDWWAALALPWRGLIEDGTPPEHLRGNFYRIERPRGGAPEFSAWSPTWQTPADFHLPAHFGSLYLTL